MAAMTPVDSDPELLVLHGVRLAGMGDAPAIAGRWGLDHKEVHELLLDLEAQGWVTAVEELCGVLTRFQGYDDRFAAALARVDAGDRSWVDRPGADSCHTVWFQLHEDLLATLGIRRDEEGR